MMPDLAQGPSRIVLKDALRRHLEIDLLDVHNVPIWLAGDWNRARQVYNRVFKNTFRIYCGVFAAVATLRVTRQAMAAAQAAPQSLADYVGNNIDISQIDRQDCFLHAAELEGPSHRAEGEPQL